MSPRKSKAPIEPSKGRTQFRLLGKIRNSPKRIKRDKVVHFHQLGLLAETRKGLPSLQDVCVQARHRKPPQDDPCPCQRHQWLGSLPLELGLDDAADPTLEAATALRLVHHRHWSLSPTLHLATQKSIRFFCWLLFIVHLWKDTLLQLFRNIHNG